MPVYRRLGSNRVYAAPHALVGLATLLSSLACPPIPAAAAASATVPTLQRHEIEFFEGRIRPILVEKCYSCHSAAADKLKGGLRLDSAESLRQGGDSGPAFVAGEPDRSRIIHAVRYTDPDLRMPPKEPLSADQIADLEAWIRMGAPDPRLETTPRPAAGAAELWSLKPVRNPPVPRSRNRAWPLDAIDQFILAKLEADKLTPNPPADKRTLLRRLTFDLTGLPPTPDELEAYLANTSPKAYEQAVDRLLASRAFAERWARHWLDVARYADSNGLESNIPYPSAWRYRNYVIDSFHEDKPFDRFIIEQIAGDLLPAQSDAERHQLWIATGLLALGPKVFTEPNRNKLLMDVVDDQIDVTTKTFLGLTVSCARCHDHKFDPIPTRDYYALAGVFRSTVTLAEAQRPSPTQTPWVERPLADSATTARFEAHQKRIDEIQEALREARRRKMELPGDIDAASLKGIIVDNSQAIATGSWNLSTYSTNFINKDYVHDGKSDKGRKSLRFTPNLPAAGHYEVRFAYPHNFNRSTNTPVTLQTADGERTFLIDQTQPPPADRIFLPLGTFRFDAGTNGSALVSNQGTTGFVVADAFQFIPAATSGSMAMASKAPTVAEGPSMRTTKVPAMGSPEQLQLQRELAALRTNAPPPLPTAMAVREAAAPTNSRVHLRGDPEKLGEPAPRAALSALAEALPAPALDRPDSSGRLELAQWIAHSDNPLTARVMANRIWQHLLGRGLVETPDNFGHLGSPPSHPELLDHLATRFVANGWSIKSLVRAIVLSRTYQLSAAPHPAAHAADPDNRLLARAHRRRLDAESLRDAMLLASGQLDRSPGEAPTNLPPQMGLPQPAAMPTSPTSNSNRRSIYLPVIRNDVPDILQVFDFVDPHVINGKRHTTTAAPQALFLLNSPFVIDQARHFAQSLPRTGTPDLAVRAAFVRALGRPPSAAETQASIQFIDSYQAELRRKPEPATSASATTSTSASDQAWQSFCQSLLASTEFRYLE